MLAASCIVDKEMDLGKDIDPVVTVLPGMTVAFGDAGLVRTGAILHYIVQANQAVPNLDIVDLDPNGNFCYSSGNKELKSPPLLDGPVLEASKPALTLSCVPHLDATSSASVEMSGVLELSGSPRWAAAAEAARNIVTVPFALNLSMDLSMEGASAVTLEKGFRLTLPDYLKISTIHTGSRFAADGAHALVTTESITLKTDESIPVSLDVTAGNDASFQYRESIRFSGDLRLSGRITVTPGNGLPADAPLTCRLTGETKSAALSEADIQVGGSLPCQTLDTYTSLVNYASPYINLSDLEISLLAENRMSVPLDLDARLQAEDTAGVFLCDYPVGVHEGGEPVLFPAKEKSAWFFSGQSSADGFTPYLFPGLPAIVSKGDGVHYGFADLRVTPREAVWQHVDRDAGEGLFQGSAKLYMPIMIGNGVDSALDFKFGHFQVDTTMTLERLTPVIFQMDIENTIPVSFQFSAEIVDKDGEVIPQYKPVVEGGVKAGTDTDPGLSTITVKFTTREIVPFDGIKLTLTVDSAAHVGEPLNRYQGIAFRHLRLVTPEGLTFDPAWLKYVRYLMDVKRVVDDVMEIVDSFSESGL